MGNTPKGYETAKILLATSRILSATLDLSRVCDSILTESINAFRVDHASLFLLDENSNRLMLTKAKGFSRDEIDNIKLLGSWEVINDYLIRKKQPVIVNDVNRNPIFKRKELPFSKERLPVKSFLAVPLKKDGKVMGALIVSNKKRSKHIFRERDKELLLGLSNHIAIALLNAKVYQGLKALFISIVKSLVTAIDAKDPYTSGHSERVMKYSLAIGKELKLAEENLENLGLSSILHDVGKIGIKEAILSKPEALSARERDQITRHPLIGVKIVSRINNSQKIIRGILEHHEKYDGTGYPNRLKGRQISLQGRVIAIADTFDALTTNRPYRKGYTAKEGFFEIRKGMSNQFDPKAVRAFVLSFSRHPEIWMNNR